MRQLLLTGLLLLGAAVSARADMLQVVYQDQEPGSAPYLSRYLITPEYVRIDQGKDDDSFLVLDRRKKTLFDVQPDRREALVIKSAAIKATTPAGMQIENRTQARPERGKTAVEQMLSADGQTCAQVLTVEGQHPEVARVLREFRRVLAASQWRTWQQTPASQQQRCDLALHVLRPGQEYGTGLPLALSYYNGLKRTLLQVDEVAERPQLFIVPLNYTLTELPH